MDATHLKLTPVDSLPPKPEPEKHLHDELLATLVANPGQWFEIRGLLASVEKLRQALTVRVPPHPEGAAFSTERRLSQSPDEGDRYFIRYNGKAGADIKPRGVRGRSPETTAG